MTTLVYNIARPRRIPFRIFAHFLPICPFCGQIASRFCYSLLSECVMEKKRCSLVGRGLSTRGSGRCRLSGGWLMAGRFLPHTGPRRVSPAAESTRL